MEIYSYFSIYNKLITLLHMNDSDSQTKQKNVKRRRTMKLCVCGGVLVTDENRTSRGFEPDFEGLVQFLYLFVRFSELSALYQ